MHSFRLRLILALIASVTIVSVAFTYFDVLAHRHAMRIELDRRTQWMGISILPDIEGALRTGDPAKIEARVRDEKYGTSALALALFDTQGRLVASDGQPEVLQALSHTPVAQSLQKRAEVSQFGKKNDWNWLETAFPLYVDNQIYGSMALSQTQVISALRPTASGAAASGSSLSASSSSSPSPSAW